MAKHSPRPSVEIDSLVTRVVLAEAIRLSGKSKYAFAKAGGIGPSLLNRYLSEKGSEMTARKLDSILKANGLNLSFKMHFDEAQCSGIKQRPVKERPQFVDFTKMPFFPGQKI